MIPTKPYLFLALNLIGTGLFFYVLYLVGGIARDMKRLLQKVEELERKFEAK